jgi:CBS domain containing-hemolysin-like protein
MSPRAACRLETLGFAQVHDYVAGKVDWLAHDLPVQRREEVVTAARLARTDVVTCALADQAAAVRERIRSSPYGFALVTAGGGVVLGRLRASVIDAATGGTAEDLMDPGPSTVRADLPAAALAKRLRERDLRTAIVTNPEGVLIGVALRDELANL